MKGMLISVLIVTCTGTAMADNHINNALSHNGMSPTEFGPTSKDDGRSATSVPGSGAGLGSEAGKRGNLGTPGGAKNGTVAPCSSTGDDALLDAETGCSGLR